jgi:hypothetical protein
MPKGLKRIAQIAEEGKAKRDAYDAGGGDYQRALVLKPGQTATGRFCEEGDDVTYVYTHDLPKKPNQSIADKILCLNQDDDPNVRCYACEQEIGRSTRLVMNFIRYDEPKLKRGADNKPLKDNFGNYQLEMTFDSATGQQKVVTEPALVIFATGAGAGGRLAYLEAQKGSGMTRHVCTIARTSDNTNPYMIDVVEENKVPPAPWEVELFNKKIDPLKAITKLGKRSVPALSYNDMVTAYSGMSVGSGFTGVTGGDNGAQTAPTGNVYADAASAGGGINPGAFGS